MHWLSYQERNVISFPVALFFKTFFVHLSQVGTVFAYYEVWYLKEITLFNLTCAERRL